MIEGKEVEKHDTADSCWVVVHGKVWDVTDFLNEHPGGAGVILKCAGSDATAVYDAIHNPELVADTLPAKSCLGTIKPDSPPKQNMQPLQGLAQSPESQSDSHMKSDTAPPIHTIINTSDFEKVAERSLSPVGWAYYSSGAEDEQSLTETRRVLNKIFLRPRILRNVEAVSTRTDILGRASSLPLYISATGLGRYAHRDAEKILASVAGEEEILYMMPTSPSHSHEAIFAARSRPDQPLFFQLYANRDRGKAEALVRKVEALGASAIFLTVDSPVLGRRERDDRVKLAAAGQASTTATTGVAKTSAMGLLNPSLVWDDLAWLRSITALPLVLKGVQTVEDAVLAHSHGAQGIVLSTHGGRSLDAAQPPVLTLLEIRRHAPYLLSPGVRKKFQVFVDGGIRRGTDIIKVLALGATAVGVGRPFLYSMTAGYGADGVRRLVRILRGELVTNMALTGAVGVEDLGPEMVNSERAENILSRRIKL